MKVLVTGAKGFIGKNLITELEQRENVEVLPYDIDTPQEMLEQYCADCDFVFNLAGVNRPEHTEEFMECIYYQLYGFLQTHNKTSHGRFRYSEGLAFFNLTDKERAATTSLHKSCTSFTISLSWSSI